jgi:hypothetical protein
MRLSFRDFQTLFPATWVGQTNDSFQAPENRSKHYLYSAFCGGFRPTLDFSLVLKFLNCSSEDFGKN